jgi:prepilin-type N-terminal cleavage/methylation domain-containing protein
MTSKGFTVMELMMAVAVMGIVMFGLANSVKYLLKSQVRNTAQANLQDDAIQILQRFNDVIRKAGDGVPNSAATGQSIFADTTVDCSSITFFYRDSGSVPGQMDGGDLWMSYQLQGGQIYEVIYQTNTWTAITATTVPYEKREIQLSPSTVVQKLQFNLYTSADPPVRTTTAFPASRLRVHLELASGGLTVSKDSWISLDNVLHAPQYQ